VSTEFQARLRTAFYINKESGQIEVDIPKLLKAAGWEDTEENRDKAMEIAMAAAKEALPRTVEHWRSRHCKIAAQGVWIFGRHYYHDAMSKLKGQTVEVRWRDGDESEVLILKAGAKFTARAVSGETTK
jgi:hypothetical protein